MKTLLVLFNLFIFAGVAVADDLDWVAKHEQPPKVKSIWSEVTISHPRKAPFKLGRINPRKTEVYTNPVQCRTEQQIRDEIHFYEMIRANQSREGRLVQLGNVVDRHRGDENFLGSELAFEFNHGWPANGVRYSTAPLNLPALVPFAKSHTYSERK